VKIGQYRQIYKKYKSKSFRSATLLKTFFESGRYNLKKRVVVDVGCGIGRSLDYLQKHKVSCFGVEVSRASIKEIRCKGYRIINASAADLSMIADSSVGLYLSADVYEHLHSDDVDVALEEAKRITAEYIAIKIEPGPDKKRKYHLTMWPPQKWEAKFKSHGLRIVERIKKVNYIMAIN